MKHHEDWTKQIAELETFFNSVELTDKPIQLGKGVKITDTKKMVRGHLLTIKFSKGKDYAKPYLNRLNQLKSML